MIKPFPGRIGLTVLHLVLLVSSVSSGQAVDWPQFRGPSGDGRVSPAENAEPIGLPLEWSETNHVKWKTEIPQRGWSSPVVMGDQVWLTTATSDGHEFFVIAVDATTGKILLNEKLFTCEKPEPLGNSVNCYATPTPAVEPGRVYIHFGSYGTACLDTGTKQVLWKRDDLRCRHYRGPASSPILYQDTVILSMDGADLQYLVALDKKTGKTVWKTDRSVPWNDESFTDQMTRDGDRRKAHGTPLIVQVKGKPMMLSTGAKAAYGYDPETGRELWRVQYDAWSAAPMPVYDQKSGLAFLITGLGKTELLAVRVDGQGDVTDTHVAWKTDAMVAKTASPILIDGLFYMVSDEGMLTCLEPATGKQVWRQRLGGNYSASPIYADGRMFFFSQQGKTSIIKPGGTFEPTGTNTLGSGFMASPAVSGKALFLRSKTHLYRVEAD
jgi:outer membrane protein assembly factor BamB